MTAAKRESAIQDGPSNIRWVVLTLWIIGHTWGHVVMGSLGFMLPSMRKELGLSPIQEGFLGSSPQVANMLLTLPFGLVLSRVRPKLLTSISFFMGAAIAFFQGWAPVYIVLLLGRFLYGAATVSRDAARVLLVRQWIPPNEIVIANALVNFLWGIVGLGIMLTPFLLKLLDDSWRNTFYVFGAISLVVATIWHLFGRERITEEYEAQFRSQETSPLGSIFRYREVWILALGMLGVGINFSAFMTFWPTFMQDEYGVSLTRTALVMAVGGGVTSITGLGMGYLVSKVGRKRQILILSGLILTSSSVGLLWTGSFTLLILLFMFQSTGWTFFPITMTIPYELPGIKPREIAVAATALSSVMWVGAFVGPVLAGALHEASGDLRMALMTTSMSSITMSIGGLLLPRVWDRSPRETQQTSLAAAEEA